MRVSTRILLNFLGQSVFNGINSSSDITRTRADGDRLLLFPTSPSNRQSSLNLEKRRHGTLMSTSLSAYFQEAKNEIYSANRIRKALTHTYEWINGHVFRNFESKFFRFVGTGCFYIYNTFIYLVVPVYYIYRTECSDKEPSLLSARQVN